VAAAKGAETAFTDIEHITHPFGAEGIGVLFFLSSKQRRAYRAMDEPSPTCSASKAQRQNLKHPVCV